MASGLRLFRDRVGNQLTADPVLDTSGGEKLMHVETSVVISLGNRLVEAAGTLYVTTKYHSLPSSIISLVIRFILLSSI